MSKDKTSLIEAVEVHFKKIHDMPFEEKKAYFDEIEGKNLPKCDPKTCQGQCQGMGGCSFCIEFQKEIERETWCDGCKGVGYNEGCKKCDPDYNGTMLIHIENQLACALASPERRVEYLISALKMVHEHPLWGGFNKEHFEERVKYMLEGQDV